MNTFDFNGLPIAYVRSGEGAPLILLHNGGTSHAIWRAVMARLESRYEVFALDLLGYGASAKPGTGYALDNYAAMVGAFLDEFDLAPATLIGNCMGSAMSLAFARQRPELVSALVLINPLTRATFDTGILGATDKFRRTLPALAAPLYRIAGRVRLPRWSASQVLSLQLGSVGRANGVQHHPDLQACHASHGQLHSMLGVVEDLGSYGELDRFEPGPDFPPLCTIWGIENKILSPDAGMVLNRRLHPAREEWLEGCGHLCMLERPDEVASIISEFLSAHSGDQTNPTHNVEAAQ